MLVIRIIFIRDRSKKLEICSSQVKQQIRTKFDYLRMFCLL